MFTVTNNNQVFETEDYEEARDCFRRAKENNETVAWFEDGTLIRTYRAYSPFLLST